MRGWLYGEMLDRSFVWSDRSPEDLLDGSESACATLLLGSLSGRHAHSALCYNMKLVQGQGVCQRALIVAKDQDCHVLNARSR